MDNFEERVRERAYRLWVEEGCPEGRSDIHWDKARELVAIEDNQKSVTKPVSRPQGGTGEPVEPIEAVENAGEFPTLTDQGEEQTAPKRRGATAERGGTAERSATNRAATDRAPAKPKNAAKPKAPKQQQSAKRI